MAHYSERGKALYLHEFGELGEQLVYWPLDNKAVMFGTPDEAKAMPVPRAIKCGTSAWGDCGSSEPIQTMVCTDCPRTATHGDKCRDCHEALIMRHTRAAQEKPRGRNESPFGKVKVLK